MATLVTAVHRVLFIRQSRTMKCPLIAISSRCVVVGLAVVLLAASPTWGQRGGPLVDGYYNIGNIHHPVSTDSAAAQTWFDRGVAMCFGFNHEEAVRCFDKALEADPRTGDRLLGQGLRLGSELQQHGNRRGANGASRRSGPKGPATQGARVAAGARPDRRGGRAVDRAGSRGPRRPRPP